MDGIIDFTIKDIYVLEQGLTARRVREKNVDEACIEAIDGKVHQILYVTQAVSIVTMITAILFLVVSGIKNVWIYISVLGIAIVAFSIMLVASEFVRSREICKAFKG